MFKVLDCFDIWPGETPQVVFKGMTEADCRNWIEIWGIEDEWHSRGDYAIIDPKGRPVGVDLSKDEIPF